jgi:hypothetical protein
MDQGSWEPHGTAFSNANLELAGLTSARVRRRHHDSGPQGTFQENTMFCEDMSVELLNHTLGLSQPVLPLTRPGEQDNTGDLREMDVRLVLESSPMR